MDADTTSAVQSKPPTRKIHGVSTTIPTPIRRERGESDDSDNTDSEEEGYDSDVQHDRSMDYNARILINPVRSKDDKQQTLQSSAKSYKPM